MLEKGSFKHRPKVILEYDRKCRVRGGFDKLYFLGKGAVGGSASRGVGDAQWRLVLRKAGIFSLL